MIQILFKGRMCVPILAAEIDTENILRSNPMLSNLPCVVPSLGWRIISASTSLIEFFYGAQ
jgi:hypothetical protein